MQKNQEEFNKLKLTFNNTGKKGDKKKGKLKGKGKKKKKQDSDKKDFLPIEEYRKQRYDNSPDWMKKKPTNLNEEKDVKGKTYYWCSNTKHLSVELVADSFSSPLFGT